LSDINEQRMILVEELKVSLDKKASDDEINHTIDSLVDYATKADDTRRQMFSDLRSILTAKQAAKVALFEAQFQKKLRETLSRMQQHRDHGMEGPHLH
ncbi:MAG TPA: hypothetical protein VFJ29_00335, partial [Candidatus Kapabacteria bacterium]|nr:hypothetical protein [Candidatus Kapabacteria bacterium]